LLWAGHDCMQDALTPEQLAQAIELLETKPEA
jgi:hypothetical protein